MCFESLPPELLVKILQNLNFNEINNLCLINSNLANLILSIIPLLYNPEFTYKFISKTLQTQNLQTQKIGRLLINNIDIKYNIIRDKWNILLKLRFKSLFDLKKKIRYAVRIVPNQIINSKLLHHKERNIIMEPEIFINGNYNNDLSNFKLHMDVSYHNSLFNKTIGEEAIIFNIRTSILIIKKRFRTYGNIRIGNTRIDMDNYYGYSFLTNKVIYGYLNYTIDNKEKHRVKIELPKLSNLKTVNDKISFGCYIMSIFLTLPYNDTISGNIVTDIMREYMDCNKKNIIQNLLFGNLKELYVPQGNFINY
jgi:hypothetical protein